MLEKLWDLYDEVEFAKKKKEKLYFRMKLIFIFVGTLASKIGSTWYSENPYMVLQKPMHTL